MPTKKQSILSHDNCINFNFKDFEQAYIVEIMIKDGNDEPNLVSYKVNVNYTKEYNQPYYLVQVIVSDFLLNFRKPDSILEEIAVTCRKSFEKCIFQVNNSNKIIDLHNHKVIVKKWETIKEQLRQENEGETFEQYIALFEKSLLDKNQLLQKLKKDTFIKQYFFPIFEEPYHGFERKGVEYFTFFNFDYDEEMLLKIENEGLLDKDANALLTKTLIRNKKNTIEFPIESYETKYKLNQDHAILEIKGEFVNHGKKYEFEIEQQKKLKKDTIK